MKEIRRLKRVVVKEELVALTNDMESAIILNQFIYWSERIRDFDRFINEENERRKKGNLPDSSMELQNGWIYKDLDELKDELMFTCSTKTISRKITTLTEKGWLDRRNNPNFKWDRTYQYRVNLINIINDLYKLGYILQDYKVDLQVLISCNGQSDDCNGQNDVSNGQDDDAIPKITTETTTDITTINQSIENESKKKNTNKEEFERLIDIDNKFKSIGYKTYDELLYELQLKIALNKYPYENWLSVVEKAIWEMYYYDNTKVKNRMVDQYEVVTKLQNLTLDMIINAIDKVNEASQYDEIKYPTAFMKIVIFNEIDEYFARVQAQVNYDLNENTKEEQTSKNNYSNRFHNFEGTSKNYSEDDIEKIVDNKRKEYYKKNKGEDYIPTYVYPRDNIEDSTTSKGVKLEFIEKVKGSQYESVFTNIKAEITPAAYNSFFKETIIDIKETEDTAILKIGGDNLTKQVLENKFINLIEKHFSSIGIEKVLIENA